MGYGGESNAKKLARATLWNHIWRIRWKGGQNTDDRILVLVGPEAADIRCLRALEVDPRRVTAVDTNAEHIEASRALVPEANYVAGDVFDYLAGEGRKGFDVMFLDFCGPTSAKCMDDVAKGVMHGLRRNEGIVAIGHMYGRERKESGRRINKHKSVLRNSKKGKKSQKTVKGKMRITAAARAAYWFKALAERFVGGRMLESTVAFITYQSSRKASHGVPMFYVAWIVHRLPRMLGKLGWDEANMAFSRKLGKVVLMKELGGDPDGKKVREEALYWAESYPSVRVADFLNLKRQQVAAWKAWRTMREREEGGSEVHE